ncbi:MAG: hypothetical protein NW224_28265 [Leptolyngbyaceae cyanobacterium bins.302]|nr:hypothetical protein [Leptolyngbyaceae cyanobacterium bins.302]
MKPELQRIEAALEEASNQYLTRLDPLEQADVWNAPPSTIAQASPERPEISPSISHDRSEPGMSKTNGSSVWLNSPAIDPQPNLPEFAMSASNRQLAALTNSVLTINLLKDLQTQVATWISSLENLLLQIQAVYDEGPIVDGWLESSNPANPAQSSYRLCGLDEEGHVWHQNCPQAQVPDVGLAIVRYQRLQSLLSQKQSIETRLGRVTELLVEVHRNVSESDG